MSKTTDSEARRYRFATEAVHRGEEPDFSPGGSGDVVVPIHLSTTFARKEADKPTGGYEYSRSGNPTRAALEKRLAALEGGSRGLAFSSGVAAQTAISLAFLRSGDHVIVFDDVYGGTRRLFTTVFCKQYGIDVDYVDASSTDAVRDAMTPRTRLIWLESPTNPLLKLCDITAISEMAHASGSAGTDTGVLVVVDNTFASPYFQNPLGFGADIVVHSGTKYLGGHSDCVGGAVITGNEELAERVWYVQNSSGGVLSPFDSYMLLRGIKTLPLRMERCSENALKIAEFLEAQGGVERVRYPGLPGFSQRELFERQMRGAGGMLTFELPSEGLAGAKRFLASLSIMAVAESLGAVETLIEHPAIMTHASVPVSEREKIGITDSLIRVSVGIEDADDLIDDLRAGFAAL